MNSDILIGIIYDAQKKNKAVRIYVNLIRDLIIIEPEQEIKLIDNVLQINEETFISTEYISMVQITSNEKEREEQLKKIFEEMKSCSD